MSLKQRLLKSRNKVIKSLEIDGVPVNLCRPNNPERLAVFDAARAAGEVDESRQPTSEQAGLRLLARVVATVMRDPETGERVFDPGSAEDIDAICAAPWFDDVPDDAMKAMHPSMEEVQGNS
ncbi:hypothetical protein VZQ01_06840 [Myxococcus faecalis]|uniref:hypothetical protein n=1 Tax=Myxococcus faecalis TaxID=3115646 RepID=UPI003CE9A1C6